MNMKKIHFEFGYIYRLLVQNKIEPMALTMNCYHYHAIFWQLLLSRKFYMKISRCFDECGVEGASQQIIVILSVIAAVHPSSH